MLKIDITLFLCRGRSDLDDIWLMMQTDMPTVVMVENETGSRIPIWWTFVFVKPEIVSAVD